MSHILVSIIMVNASEVTCLYTFGITSWCLNHVWDSLLQLFHAAVSKKADRFVGRTNFEFYTLLEKKVIRIRL